MERQKIKQHIENYKLAVERSIYEPIVNRDVGHMTVDTAKAFFLLLPMLNGERWTDRLNTAAIAVGAVHAAFDAHDMINVSNATSKRQQLTVLSGDHFSGVHYRLLASIPELGFIRSLSGTIGKINEVKTTLHDQLPGEPKQLAEAIRIIEAGCIVDFLDTFGFSQYAALANAALPLLMLNNKIAHDQPISGGKNGHKWHMTDIEHAITLLDTELLKAIETADFLAPILQQEIRNLATPLLGKPI